MGIVGASLGLAAALGLAISALSMRKHPTSVCVGLTLLFVWFVGVPVMQDWLEVKPPYLQAAWASIDVLLAIWAAKTWLRERDGYVLIYLGLVVIQAWVHVSSLTQPQTHGAVNDYKLLLNLTFFAQVLCGAWPGLKDAVARLGDYLRGHGHANIRMGV